MDIYEAFAEAASNKELVTEFNRLYDKKFMVPRSPIEQMVDKATGFDRSKFLSESDRAFADFFMQCIWVPLVAIIGTNDDTGNETGG